LIAILLGCLELGIEDCIEKYLSISKKVFGTVNDVSSFAAAERHEPTLLDWEDLGLAVKGVLQGLGKDEDRLFSAPVAVSCKV